MKQNNRRKLAVLEDIFEKKKHFQYKFPVYLEFFFLMKTKPSKQSKNLCYVRFGQIIVFIFFFLAYEISLVCSWKQYL